MKLQICRLLPGLRVLNSRPIDKYIQNEKDNRSDKDDDTSIKKLELQKEKKNGKMKRNAQMDLSGEGSDGELDDVNDFDMEKKSQRKKCKMDKVTREEKEVPSLYNKKDHDTNDIAKDKKSLKKKMVKNNEEPSPPVHEETHNKIEKQKKTKKEGKRQVDVVDDTEVPFEELFGGDGVEDMDSGREKFGEKAVEDVNLKANLLSFAANRNESKKHDRVTRLQISSPVAEIGMGGPSMWADE